MTNNVLTIDFGSTYTKAILLDLESELIMSHITVNTQSKTNLFDSYQELITKMAEDLKIEQLPNHQTLICSSAFGGFNMVAIGLTHSLTTAAAKKVALGAGTRILKTFSYSLSSADIQKINQLNPDVILLTGGTDGGNTAFILDCAQKLTHLNKDIPLIVAGNRLAAPEIKRILMNRTYYLTENVLPKVNLIQATDTRERLRRIFFEKIIYGKGFDQIAKLSNSPIIPTPMAVLHAVKLLSQGSGKIPGFGKITLVDVGGATTDVHSACESISDQQLLYEGLPEPFLKRTVEGDLGMRYSAVSLFETAGPDYFNIYGNHHYDETELRRNCLLREQHPDFIPSTPDQSDFDNLMAKIAVSIGMDRHAGVTRRERHPRHDTYYQQGKDLRQIDLLIGTGGIIINSSQPKNILKAALQTDTQHLKPLKPAFYLDSSYIVSSLGLLAEHHPQVALRMLTKYLIPL
ncbi:methylaspartate mutase accessory protein GlmL [uncultured Vagococcus sp.]|uniref:methylaspartate mutase accessory protein GlmL n=1 Tax=uncultured Vagococcus sp. TaxID=189676 RepID=UPI0028D8BCD6|nr:methylaspartate mutase accessory protein GlmL [uncultured Vagococcus sp.]